MNKQAHISSFKNGAATMSAAGVTTLAIALGAASPTTAGAADLEPPQTLREGRVDPAI